MTRAQLLATLTAVADDDAISFDDGRYIDWSTKAGDGRQLEVGNVDDGEAVQVELSRSDMMRLHAALTRTLLAMQDE